MKRNEFLAISLPYGLKICDYYDFDRFSISTLGGIQNGSYYDKEGSEMENFKSIVRPLDSLTKKCIQADYNDGNPFIPIVELEILSDRGSDHAFLIAWEDRKYDSSLIECMPFWMAQMLLKWHFSLITEDCEKVYVTNDFNPYK